MGLFSVQFILPMRALDLSCPVLSCPLFTFLCVCLQQQTNNNAWYNHGCVYYYRVHFMLSLPTFPLLFPSSSLYQLKILSSWHVNIDIAISRSLCFCFQFCCSLYELHGLGGWAWSLPFYSFISSSIQDIRRKPTSLVIRCSLVHLFIHSSSIQAQWWWWSVMLYTLPGSTLYLFCCFSYCCMSRRQNPLHWLACTLLYMFF